MPTATISSPAPRHTAKSRLDVVVSAQRFSPPLIVITAACALVVK
ncbi:hypothetical protein ATKI12_3385 [Kitasatospora sp. Ki12]